MVHRNRPSTGRLRPYFLAVPSPLAVACAATALAGSGLFQSALAQVPPTSAGQILREQFAPPPPPAPPASQGFDFDIPPLPPARQQGGPTVQVLSVAFKGNTAFSDDVLGNALGEFAGKPYDLGGLNRLSDAVTAYYRNNGYPFARAFLPEQTLREGRLVIEVVEGRYGVVQATGEPGLSEPAQRYLAALRSGDLMESSRLERSLLILSDVPGIRVDPVVRAGDEPGTGDLSVRVEPQRRWDLNLELDDHGSRYSGLYRARATLGVNRVLTFGDRLVVRGLYSNEDLWLGGFTYSLPLGASGMRGFAGFDRTSYALGANFVGFTGVASVTSAGVEYPVVRSPDANFTLLGGLYYKDFDDRLQGASYNRSWSRSALAGLRFDRRDGFARGGVSFGTLSLSTGSLDSSAPGVVQGPFNKLEGQVARTQNVAGPFSLYAGLQFQATDGPVNTAEGFTLGGPARVRAYPVGEAIGSQGYVAQLELRLNRERTYPFAFYDFGNVPSQQGSPARSLAGAGLGVRGERDSLYFDLALAWKTRGGASVSYPAHDDPQFWFRIGYRL